MHHDIHALAFIHANMHIHHTYKKKHILLTRHYLYYFKAKESKRKGRQMMVFYLFLHNSKADFGRMWWS